jgi:hypothetical protein
MKRLQQATQAIADRFLSLRQTVAATRLREHPVLRTLVTYRWAAGILLNLLLIFLFAGVIYQNRELLPQASSLLTPPIIGACLGLYALSLLVQFLIWVDLMGYQGHEYPRALEEYICTTFLGWIPGGVWKYVGRMTIYRAPRLSSRAILMNNLVEICLLLLANGSILLAVSPLPWPYRLAGGGILLLVLVLLSRAIAPSLPSFASPSSPASAAPPRAGRWTVWTVWMVWTGGYGLAWLCGGAITFLVVSAFHVPLLLSDALAYWCIAGASGILMQALPINALVRDVTMTMLLTRTGMPLSEAVIAAFALRLMMLACELSLGWAALALVSLKKRFPWFPFALSATRVEQEKQRPG